MAREICGRRRVEFEIWDGLRGLQAARVMALDPDGEALQVVISLRLTGSDFATALMAGLNQRVLCNG